MHRADGRSARAIRRSSRRRRRCRRHWRTGFPRSSPRRSRTAICKRPTPWRTAETWPERWSPAQRGNHEGYVAGYFIESAINHYTLTDGKDLRLYNAAKKLADCWVANIGPGKKEWFDGHQEMEQALVRFGRFVNDMEGNGRGDAYITLAKFLLDSRRGGQEYDQSHLPPGQQYEAVGHAVRATYFYSGMADVAAETGDRDYQSAVMSLWDNMVNKKYYVTGGIGSGETSEGFGPNYSLRNNAYCESCSSCGLIFFQYKLNLAYHDARYADLYEETIYNALLGATDLEGEQLLLHQPAGQHRAHALARLPLLRQQHLAHAAHDSDLDLCEGGERDLCQPVYRQPHPGGESGGHGCRDGAEDRLSVERDGRDHGQPGAVQNLFGLCAHSRPRHQQALHGDAGRQRREAVRGQRQTRDAADRERLCRGHARMEGGGPHRTGTASGASTHPGGRPIVADQGRVALRYGPLLYNVERADQPNIDQPLSAAPLKAVWRPDLLGGVMALEGSGRTARRCWPCRTTRG